MTAEPLTPETMIRDVTGIPVTPQVLPKLQRLLRDVDSSLDDIVALVRLEPVLAGQIVRLSNTAAYSTGQKCSSVEESFNRVGFSETEKLVSLAVVAGIVDKPLSTYQLSGAVLWTRSIATALAAERLASMNRVDVRTAYSLGLLSSVGLLVIDRYTTTHKPVTISWNGFPQEYRRGEEGTYGFNSYTVGAALMRKWGFAEEMASALEAQSNLDQVKPSHRKMAAVLYVARFLRSVLCDEKVREVDENLLGELDLARDSVLSLAGELRGELFQAKRMV